MLRIDFIRCFLLSEECTEMMATQDCYFTLNNTNRVCCI